MIYTCQQCGEWFTTDAIREAMERNDTVIGCRYCGGVTEFRAVKSSHIAKGFDFLGVGNFYLANMEFTTAIEDAKRCRKSPSPDVYLGFALAQFRVQTLFSDEDPNKLNPPKLICHQRNEVFFKDNRYFRQALNCCRTGNDASLFATENAELINYADYIDTIKNYYDEIASEKPDDFKYGVFIAYEDEPEDGEENGGFITAHKVYNTLHDGIKNVFLPDINNYDGDKLRYEAEILYAIDHSNCMVVIADNDIDSRLTNIYSRYYFKDGNESKLCFVRYCDRITINLPDQSIANNVFDIDDKFSYNNFICINNGIFLGRDFSSADIASRDENKESREQITFESIYDNTAKSKPYDILPGKQFSFGSYPQRRETGSKIVNCFNGFDKPSIDDANGWTILLVSKSGKPYTWYRDEIIDGEKYRGVYFIKFREAFSVQDSDVSRREQRVQGYMPAQIYCFKFMPLIWDKVDMSKDIAVLVTDQGIDSCEYNNHELDNAWERSSIKLWLNDKFINTAFNEKERGQLMSLGGFADEKVYLIDRKFDKKGYDNGRTSIPGTDYMRCVGGMCDNRAINSYWLLANESDNPNEAPVVFPASRQGLSTQFVDSTSVAIIPKIVLKL